MGTILVNKTRDPKCYVLHAQHVADQLPVVRMAVPVEKHDPLSGATEVKTQVRRLPSSLSLMPKGVEGDRSPALPDAVRHIPEIKADLHRGFLALIDVAEGEPAAPPLPTPEPPALPDEPAPARPRRGDK